MQNIFKNKNDEEGNNVIDEFIDKVLQLLVLVRLAAQQIKNVVTK